MPNLKDVVEISTKPSGDYERFMLDGWRCVDLAAGSGGVLAFVLPAGADVAGFEAGLLTARLSAKPSKWRGAYHVSSAEVLGRVAKAFGYEVKPEPPMADGVWMFCEFIPLPNSEEATSASDVPPKSVHSVRSLCPRCGGAMDTINGEKDAQDMTEALGPGPHPEHYDCPCAPCVGQWGAR